jgi:hypothetical protein
MKEANMRLWKSCGKPVDTVVDKLRCKVIHISIPKISTGISTGFPQDIFLNFSLI